MLHNKINLLANATQYGFMPYMETYILEGEKRPLVVICPGGGYEFTSKGEAERIAVGYNSAGFHAIIVWYCVAPHKHPMPIKNVAKAISVAKENAYEWNIDKDKIFVCGFSAGGHLAASICTMWNDNDIFSKEEIKSELYKPRGSILSYPVISSGEFAHKGSFNALTQTNDESDELWDKLSLEKRVNAGTPPAFIWHTFEDTLVPVENSLLYANAMRKNNIPFELHIFDKGEHGLSLVSDEVIWSKPKFDREYPWLKLSVDWINNL